MLSYRHSFHAGNHADVLKHIVLMLILENLSLKEKGFYYLDTHSGVGRYRLSSNESEKTGEYKEGIGRLWERTDLPEEVARYVDLIKNSIMAVKNYAITRITNDCRAIITSSRSCITNRITPERFSIITQ